MLLNMLRVTSSLLKPFDALANDEAPILAVRVLPVGQPLGRRPFHLALLLDTSGSMEGPRIDAVKRTLNLLIDAMTDSDILSVITYCDTASVLIDAVAISEESRVTLHSVANNLHADGSTNIEAAILAIGQLSAQPQIDSLFLLTDGHINVGIASSAGLQRILQSIVPAGTPVNTLGFGSDHNSRILSDLAVHSRGSYTYADADEMLPAIIGNIMGGLEMEVGRRATLTIPAGWRCMELGSKADDTHYVIGTLVADKEQWILFEGQGVSVIPNCMLEWYEHTNVHTERCLVDTTMDSLVIAEQYCRILVTKAFGEATTLLESGRIEEARTVLTNIGAKLDTSPANGRPFVVRLHAQIDDMLASLASHTRGDLRGQQYLGSVVARATSGTTTLGVQRGIFTPTHAMNQNQVSDPEEIDDSFSSPVQQRIALQLTRTYTQAP